MEILDEWQARVMAVKGNLVLRSGRQVGKSYVIAKKAAQFALDNPKKLIMVIAFVERQGQLIFAKILNEIHAIDKTQIMRGKNKPTKHIIHLKNGSTIHCYAAGETGWGLMGFTIDLLIADEAAFINEEVWNSVCPALAVTKGIIWLLSTPCSQEGFYYSCFEDPTYTSFHQSSEDCSRIPKEFLEQKKKELTKSQYAQMYLGEWTDESNRVFSDEWIDMVCTIRFDEVNTSIYDRNALGCDIAGMGDDESSFEGLRKAGDHVYQFYHEVTTKTRTTDTIARILTLNKIYDFWRIGVDDGGMGVGVFDQLLIHSDTKRKVVGLNNSKRVIDADGRTSRLQKEAMYMTTLAMGERGELHLLDSDEVRASLRSIQIDENGRINGRDAHITEGIIRGVELLNIQMFINPRIYTIRI